MADLEKMDRLLDHVKGKVEGVEGAAVEALDDREWVYLNRFQASLLKREDAPSSGAWGMLQWAAKNPDQFYRMWAVAQKEVGQKEKVLAQRKKHYPIIERAINEFAVSKTMATPRKRKKKRVVTTDGREEWPNLAGGRTHAK